MSDASFGFLDPIRTYELGPGECREASHTAPGSSWTTAAYLRIQLQSDTVFPELFLDLQAEDGSYTMAFLPLVQPLVAGSACHCRLGPSLEARSVAGGSVCHYRLGPSLEAQSIPGGLVCCWRLSPSLQAWSIPGGSAHPWRLGLLLEAQSVTAGSVHPWRLRPSLEARSVAGGSVCHWLHWRCRQPPPAQDATCTSRLFSLLVTHSL